MATESAPRPARAPARSAAGPARPPTRRPPAAAPPPAPRARSAPAPGADYERFCAGVKALTGIALEHYRAGQMERRLRTFGGRHECADLDELLALIRRDADVKDRFLDHMTINVSELFRNPERFEELERRWLPELQRTGRGGLKVWSAGCSYGAEPYSLAVLLQELTSGTPGQVLASDLDAVILARARRGRFGDQDLKNVTPARVAKWFRREDADGQAAWQVSERLKAMVRFRQHNLLTDRYPDGLDLIACRNVVIYFTDEAKDEIYRRFLAALRPGGMLFVGSTERVNGAEAMGWERAGSFFYRRPG